MISFAWPALFLFFPAPLLLRWLYPAATIQKHNALRVPFYRFLAEQPGSSALFSSRRLWFPFLLWLLILTAAAGPQWLDKPIPLPRHGRNLLLAIDISESMSLPDLSTQTQQVTRLDTVKRVASQFIQDRNGDRIGLILFGTRAYLRTPLTFDLKTAQNALEDSSIGLAGERTAIGDAILLAVKRLKDFPENSRVLILLTDGANNAGAIPPEQAAEFAAHYGIKIYTIGIGADQLIIPGLMGPERINPSGDLDETTLRDIAQKTGGTFFRAKNTKALQDVYQQINELEPIQKDLEVFRPITQLYPWPLGIAIMLSFAFFALKILPSYFNIGKLLRKEN